ncbi:MAG: hypothetical protein AW10_03043 [Candidatus Accumulibacter appositus]|uniref:Uncharacterized protein n=1 Tax=Candidatus Accumulibacter appositus TaxID=1454003 RepID=A0A011NSX2_9PROT|nr:MAG: hypothetical protein AW10_03043 [Candidatus Accumulibacter appositus]
MHRDGAGQIHTGGRCNAETSEGSHAAEDKRAAVRETQGGRHSPGMLY